MSRPPRDLDPDSLLGHFGAELRTYRTEGGLSQQQLADALGCSGQWIGQVELSEKSPSEAFALDLDTYFQTNGSFHRLWQSIRRAYRKLALPQWFKKWVEIEQQAHTLKNWEPLVVPGLLQTPDYARAVLNRQPGVTQDQIDEQIAKRIERQAILTGDEPTMLWVVIDESVLTRPIGDAAVMRDQLAHLIEMSARSNVTIQALPHEAGGSCGLAGAFWIASIRGGLDTVYLESDCEGRVSDHPDEVIATGNRYAAISADALSAKASLRLMTKVMEERWTQI